MMSINLKSKSSNFSDHLICPRKHILIETNLSTWLCLSKHKSHTKKDHKIRTVVITT